MTALLFIGTTAVFSAIYLTPPAGYTLTTHGGAMSVQGGVMEGSLIHLSDDGHILSARIRCKDDAGNCYTVDSDGGGITIGAIQQYPDSTSASVTTDISIVPEIINP